MKHLSLETSRKLKEMAAGVELPESENCTIRIKALENQGLPPSSYIEKTNEVVAEEGNEILYRYSWQEILIDHAKFFFGERIIDVSGSAMYSAGITFRAYEHVADNILFLLQQNRVEEAEAFFLDNLTFKK